MTTQRAPRSLANQTSASCFTSWCCLMSFAMSTDSEWIEPAELPLLDGRESFSGVGATVADFWRWGFGDLRMNIVRGVLSEFLIAKALGVDTSKPRDPWDNFDVRYGDITIEIKTAAKWQSYRAKKASKLVFSGLSSRRWDDEKALRRPHPEVIADIYIFAIHTCETPDDYDPLSTDQWAYFVLKGDDVRDYLGKSVSVSSLRARARECSFSELGGEVDRIASSHDGSHG